MMMAGLLWGPRSRVLASASGGGGGVVLLLLLFVLLLETQPAPAAALTCDGTTLGWCNDATASGFNLTVSVRVSVCVCVCVCVCVGVCVCGFLTSSLTSSLILNPPSPPLTSYPYVLHRRR